MFYSLCAVGDSWVLQRFARSERTHAVVRGALFRRRQRVLFPNFPAPDGARTNGRNGPRGGTQGERYGPQRSLRRLQQPRYGRSQNVSTGTSSSHFHTQQSIIMIRSFILQIKNDPNIHQCIVPRLPANLNATPQPSHPEQVSHTHTHTHTHSATPRITHNFPAGYNSEAHTGG